MTAEPQEPPRYILTVLGQDRPGIVASVARALADADCNIEHSSMTLLGTAFVMLLVVTIPQGRENAFRTGLVGVTAVDDLLLHVDPLPTGGLHQTTDGEPYTLSLHGADHPGIVAAVAGLLADQRVNIVDLSTRLMQGQVPVYVMTMDLIVPETVDPADLDARLQRLSAEIDCAITLTREETLTL